MAKDDKRVLRLKVTMVFGGQLTLPAGDYEGANIPEVLEAEYKLGSPHVDEIITRAPAELPELTEKLSGKEARNKAKLQKAKEEAEQKAKEAEEAAVAAGLEDSVEDSVEEDFSDKTGE